MKPSADIIIVQHAYAQAWFYVRRHCEGYWRANDLFFDSPEHAATAAACDEAKRPVPHHVLVHRVHIQ